MSHAHFDWGGAAEMRSRPPRPRPDFTRDKSSVGAGDLNEALHHPTSNEHMFNRRANDVPVIFLWWGHFSVVEKPLFLHRRKNRLIGEPPELPAT